MKPRKPEKTERTVIIRVRMTEAERERLAAIADRDTGGNMSELIRRRLFREEAKR